MMKHLTTLICSLILHPCTVNLHDTRKQLLESRLFLPFHPNLVGMYYSYQVHK